MSENVTTGMHQQRHDFGYQQTLVSFRRGFQSTGFCFRLCFHVLVLQDRFSFWCSLQILRDLITSLVLTGVY